MKINKQKTNTTMIERKVNIALCEKDLQRKQMLKNLMTEKTDILTDVKNDVITKALHNDELIDSSDFSINYKGYWYNLENSDCEANREYRIEMNMIKMKINKMDPVNPDYYDSVFDQILENKFSTEDLIKIDEFNVFKYIYRWRNKNGLQDLKKARWYLNSMIEKLEKLQEKEKLEN